MATATLEPLFDAALGAFYDGPDQATLDRLWGPRGRRVAGLT